MSRRSTWMRSTAPLRRSLSYSAAKSDWPDILQAIELGTAIKSDRYHVVTGIRKLPDQFAVFQQGHADLVHAGLKLFRCHLIRGQAEIHNQILAVDRGAGRDILPFNALVPDVGRLGFRTYLAHEYVEVFTMGKGRRQQKGCGGKAK